MVIITENYPVISVLNVWFLNQTANKIVQAFDRRKTYNGIKNDGKICFRVDVDAFIKMHKLINLQNNVNIKQLQEQFLKPEGVAESPENILTQFSLILLEGRDNACHRKVTLGSHFLTWHYLEVIEVFISMINNIRPECKIISAPALRECSRNYNNLIEKVKFWKKQGVKTFCFIINVILDRSGIMRALSMVIGNHWSCVQIKLQTGDVLYADLIGREVPRDFEDTFSNFFQAICKVYEKNMTLLNPCKLLMQFNQQKVRTNIFLCKKIY